MQRRRAKRLTPDKSAERIVRVLFEARPAGLFLPQLLLATQLTRSQVRRGLRRARERAAGEGWPPLIWTWMDGYHFAGDEDELERWERSRLRGRLGEVRRLITGVITPHLAMFPRSRWAQYTLTQLNAIESNLDLLDHFERPVS